MTKMNWQVLAEKLQEALKLEAPPIAITFRKEAVPGVRPFAAATPPATADGRTGKAPAGCVFWFKAVDETFSTAPEDHFNCGVGSVTHGLKRLEEILGDEDVQCLLGSEWVSAGEAMELPVIRERPASIVYGPLAETPIDPDVVLIRVNAFQAMTIHDAFSDIVMAPKPQCHIVPLARESAKIAMSTG